MPQTHHTIDYIEIPARDLAAATAFYAAAFGWRFNDYGPAYAGIRSADGEGEVGGLAATDEPTGSGGPLVLLYSDDLEATAEAVVAAGGAVVRGPYDFPGGRRLHFTDPTGNELGVWSEG
ncbi:VOC family protein [Desertihabitans aurantiacus]|uniref:VOC family protein n=1 Tax=Desertihabitans aurantiacus TaxID=2282477 RepID=UPI000DF849CB|nr:VOC family protein [Desertihabitans aurantiacus]